MEDEMATNITNSAPQIDSFDVTPVAAAPGGTVTLRAKISMTHKELKEERISFRFIGPDLQPVAYHPEDKMTMVAHWTVPAKNNWTPKSKTPPPIENGEFRA